MTALSLLGIAKADAGHYRFSVKGDQLFLNDHVTKIIGLRCSNALISDASAAELIDHLNAFKSYGVNTISVFFMGSRFGDVKGYRPDGTLDPACANRMGRIIQQADRRGMIVLVGCLYWSTSRAGEDLRHWKQADANRAVANTVRWLKENDYRNVFVDVDNEGMAHDAMGWSIAEMIDAAHGVDPTIMVAYNDSAPPPPSADLLIHHSPRVPGRPWVQTEGTPTNAPGGYWGTYSKKEGIYNYINIGLYSDEMKADQFRQTDRDLSRFNGHILASTWLQCVAPHGPNQRPGGAGTVGDPGILWWLEYVKSKHGGAWVPPAPAIAGRLVTSFASPARPRVIVETDAGGDPDDEQSLVRFLLYANEWDVEGIIANRPVARPRENLNPIRTGLGIVQQQLSAYGEVHARLNEHAPGFPTKEHLWERTVSGYADNEEGVNLIIRAVDRDDPRPIWFQNWGTDRGSDPSNLKRALDKVLAERGPESYARFKNRILLCSADKFGDHTTKMAPPFRLWVYPSLPNMDGGNWYHRFGPLTATAGGFDLERDVRTLHGPLGALYPTNTNIRQKEGDTHFFLYLIPHGLSDPMQPTWGSWAGRFGVRDDMEPRNPNYFWANQRDTLQGSTHRDHTLRRWAADIQNDFRARMDWCAQPAAHANHAPVAALNSNVGRAVMRTVARPGSEVLLSAAGSSDRDNHRLQYEWMIYPEAGTYRGAIRLAGANAEEARIEIPTDAAGREIHVILAVRDDGAPPLAAYRRAIIEVEGDQRDN